MRMLKNIRRFQMQEKTNRIIIDRREFVTRASSLCSIFCIGSSSLFALFRNGQKAGTFSEKHKFQKDSGMTYEDLSKFVVGRLVSIVGGVAEKVGIDVVQQAVLDGTKMRMAAQVKNLPKRDLSVFTQNFKSKDPFNVNTWTKEIIQDTDSVFEMRVTECIWAKTFNEMNAGDLGFKLVCSTDFTAAEAFNPKIKLIRDKTLMQGFDCCNPRYIFRD